MSNKVKCIFCDQIEAEEKNGVCTCTSCGHKFRSHIIKVTKIDPKEKIDPKQKITISNLEISDLKNKADFNIFSPDNKSTTIMTIQRITGSGLLEARNWYNHHILSIPQISNLNYWPGRINLSPSTHSLNGSTDNSSEEKNDIS